MVFYPLLRSGALNELSPIDPDNTGEFADAASNIRAVNYLCKMVMKSTHPIKDKPGDDLSNIINLKLS